jgi:hypothetical protein
MLRAGCVRRRERLSSIHGDADQTPPYVFSEAEQKASREELWTPSLFKKTWDHYRSKLAD